MGDSGMGGEVEGWGGEGGGLERDSRREGIVGVWDIVAETWDLGRY